MSGTSDAWWKTGVVYQIYPASFQDSNDDGIGDLRGITQRLGHIKDLGATIMWISPMFDSPQHDMGYDIRNYKQVYAPYGTVADMVTLLEKAHALGLKVILDLVINHTSNEHAWFQESRSSKTSSKRDWYIWKPARYDSSTGTRLPPNNWGSFFGGSAWEWDEHTQEYYLHLFAREQPDVNFENPAARRALYADSMTFWLDLGVDGFRVDTCALYSKDPAFPDAPVHDPGADFQHAGPACLHGPRIHEFLKEMGQIVGNYDAMTVGECGDASATETLKYVSARERELNSVFLFDVVDVGHGKPHRYTVAPRSWDLPALSAAIERTQRVMLGTDGWTTTFLENHDVARSISRWGDESSPEAWRASGKMLALMQATLSGTLYIYQGQEIGMINIPSSWPLSEYKDIESQRWWTSLQQQQASSPQLLAQGKASLQHLARDNSRTPMQWTAAVNAGFTSEAATPWMRVNDSARSINVAQQEGEQGSVLQFWRRMLELRKRWPGLFVFGEFELVVGKANHDCRSVMAFVKKAVHDDDDDAGTAALVVCNFTGETQEMPQCEIAGEREILVCSEEEPQEGLLKPWEGRVVLIQKKKKK